MFIFTQQLVCMYKYKNFLLFFGLIAVLLLFSVFPVAFDNNDDQVMYLISSGLLSGDRSPYLLLTNSIIGSILQTLFSISNSINWYTLYLELVLLFSFFTVCLLFINYLKTTMLIKGIILAFLFLGFYAVSFVFLQFTTVALFSAITSLFILQFEKRLLLRTIGSLLFVGLAVLIRKETIYIFLLFSIPIFFRNISSRKSFFLLLFNLLVATFVFLMLEWSNNRQQIFQEQKTYKNIKALDYVAASPVALKSTILKKYNYTEDDIILMQSWFPADHSYQAGHEIYTLAKSLRKVRNLAEVKAEVYKFTKDERYVLFVYLLTLLSILLFVRRHYKNVLLHLLLFLSLFFYLVLTYRIPHRITFPVLSYLIFQNIFLLSECTVSDKFKIVLTGIFLLLSGYKFYCTTELIALHKHYHSVYDASRNEINKHPEYLFLAADGFPLQYMNAWQKSTDNFPAHNLILTGWYTCTPDYQRMLSIHHLKNLTSDLKNKKNILVLTDSKQLQDAYVSVMKQRYNITCHFEEQKTGFTVLRPKKLVVE